MQCGNAAYISVSVTHRVEVCHCDKELSVKESLIVTQVAKPDRGLRLTIVTGQDWVGMCSSLQDGDD